MGLDITAYSHLTHVGRHTDEDWCEMEYHVQAYAYSCFPQSFRGIPILATRASGSDEEFIEGGCYAWTEGTEKHGFRAGSYGGYNRWRADLQQQFNPDRDPDGPFYELIWFADNEGSIGPEAAKDLLVDFHEHASAYVPPADWGDYGRERYADWTRAFELAAADGLVDFH
jgi:hypothetical protein